MPIGNMLAQFGNRPSLMQDVEGLRNTQMMNRLGEYKLGAAIRDEQKQNRLSELYSRGVSGDKAAFNEMAGVSPEFHMKIQEQLIAMDKTQREQLQAQMAETGRVALAAKANPQLWAQEFPDIPYEQADLMLAKLSASKDVFDAIQEQEKTQYGRFKDERAYSLDQAQFGETRRHNQASEYASLLDKNKPTEFDRLAAAAGLQPGTPEYQAAALAKATGQGPEDIRKAEEAQRGREGLAASYDMAVSSAKRLIGSEQDGIPRHPGFESAVGVSLQPSIPFYGEIPGTEKANFMAELETLKSQTFLPMVQSLKGMGALSNMEGERLTSAIGALNPNMGEKAFKTSMERIITDLEGARDRTLGRPTGSQPPAGNQSPPTGGVRFLGFE